MFANVEDRHRSQEFVNLLKTLDAYYPPEAITVTAPGSAWTRQPKHSSSPKALLPNTFGYGALELVNVDGGLDYLADLGLDGQPLTLLFGHVTRGGAPVWTTVLTGTVEQPAIGWSSVTLRLRDRQAELAKPLSPNTYAGTNALPNGLEGVDDLQGKNKPRLFGRVFNIAPPWSIRHGSSIR